MPMNHRLIHGDCLEILRNSNERWTCIFADGPDNLGLDYKGYNDNRPEGEYLNWLDKCLHEFIKAAPIVWMSYNARWTFKMGRIIQSLLCSCPWVEAKSFIQTFTFGQYNPFDLGNSHRPLLRLRRDDVPLYPDQIRIESWRQKNGDKRADPRGRVPGDVFDFPRVTGNSKQRRKWCPTQLHEGLVERCIKLSTLPGQTVLDPFAGTGTTLRVCKRAKRVCTLIEQSLPYCKEIAKEHGLEIEGTRESPSRDLPGQKHFEW